MGHRVLRLHAPLAVRARGSEEPVPELGVGQGEVPSLAAADELLLPREVLIPVPHAHDDDVSTSLIAHDTYPRRSPIDDVKSAPRTIQLIPP